MEHLSRFVLNSIVVVSVLFGSLYVPGIAYGQRTVDVFVQLGHSRNVNSVAVSKNGKYILSASSDRTLKLWELGTGREVRTFNGHSIDVYSVAFLPDGKYAISGSLDKTLRLWDITTGNEIKVIMTSSIVTSLAASPDGKYVLAGGGSLNLWEIASGKQVKNFTGHSGIITSTAYSPDGRYILSGSIDMTLKLWDVITGNAVRTFSGHSKQITSVALSPDGRFALSSSEDKTVKLWDIASGNNIRTFTHTYLVNTATFSPDGKYVLSGCRREVRLSEMGSLNSQALPEALNLWDTSTGRKVREFQPQSAGVSFVIFSSDSKYVLSADWNGTIELWDSSTGNEVRTFNRRSDAVLSVAFSPDGRYVISGGHDKIIRLWEIHTGRQVGIFTGHSDLITSVAFSPDGKYFLSGSSDTTVRLWDITTGKQVKVFNVRPALITSVAFSPNGKLVLAGTRVLSGAKDATVRVWEVSTERELASFKSGQFWTASVAFSPDGNHILSTSDENSLRLWEISTRSSIREFDGHSGTVFSISYSPDGRYALSGSYDKTVKLWDLNTGKNLKTFIGHSSGISSVAFSPDGRIAASASYDSSLKLWDVDTGVTIRTFNLLSAIPTSVVFSPDGKYLLAGFTDSTTRLWNIAAGEEAGRAVGFNDGEWIVITPPGYYNSSPNGGKYLNVRIGNKVYSIDQFFERYFRPDIVVDVLQGKKLNKAYDIANGFALPPDVMITSPHSGQYFAAPEIEIKVEARDAGGGIDEIRLYQNGKVNPNRRGISLKIPNRNTTTATYRVTLLEGDNVFRATAFSIDRTESNPYEVTVRLTAPDKQSTLYLLIVGINQYKNAALNLNFAVPDAEAIADYFKTKGSGLFRAVNIARLENIEATRPNILSAFKALQEKVQPQDVVILYFAGHGDTRNDEWYYIPYEVTRPEMDDDVVANGLSATVISDMVGKILSQKILLLLDACKSGSVMTAFRGYEDRKALAQLARSAGIHVIAATSGNQVAAEVEELGHGVFTYLLLRGLKGEAVLKNSEHVVTVRGLLAYIEGQLPELSKKYKSEAQYPISSSRGMDFPLVVVP